MSDVVDTATDLVADVAEDFADHASSFADTAREASGYSLGLVISGFAVGAGLGGAAGYFVTRRMLETKYQQIAQDEIAEMQEHYQAKTIALENKVDKPKLEDIVREQGYSTTPPMAVAPPAAVVEAAGTDDVDDTTPAELDTERDEEPDVHTQNVFELDEPQPGDGWDHSAERARRSPLRPYVIHTDEREENGGYDEITFTYYEGDDVLCNERDEIIAGKEREDLVGEANLQRFGHGSEDPNIVYVRNDRMETVIEVCRSSKTYAEEVHGFTHSDAYPRDRRERTRFDDE